MSIYLTWLTPKPDYYNKKLCFTRLPFVYFPIKQYKDCPMAEKCPNTIPDLANIKISDICGLLEINRICDSKNKVLIP